MNKEKLIELKDYKLLGELDDEEDCFDSFVNEYDSGYICDVISEIGESSVPIYNNDIWEGARNITEYIKEAQSEGLCEGVTGIEKIMQIGFYQYYTQSLYDNLNNMIYNKIVNQVNEYLESLDIVDDENFTEIIDIDEIISLIEEKSDELDDNNRIGDIVEAGNEIIERIEEMLESRLEIMLEGEESSLKIEILEDIISKGSYKESVSYMIDVMNSGCQSGTVSMLVYYSDTHSFFDRHYDDIMAYIEEYEERCGIKPIWKDDMKNWYAWFVYEKIVRDILNELNIEY